MSTPSTAAVRAAMSVGLIGCMQTPAQGNLVPPGAVYTCDNGKFGKGYPGAGRWSNWLYRRVDRFGTARCLWAAAPDVPYDAVATLAESGPWLRWIRRLGVPAAFCAQDGAENGLIPWDDVDVLFLAGSTEWKLGYAAAELASEAHARGKRVHAGRVNSMKRIKHFTALEVETADGTYIAKAPDTNLARLQRFQGEIRRREPRGVQFDLLDVLAHDWSAR